MIDKGQPTAGDDPMRAITRTKAIWIPLFAVIALGTTGYTQTILSSLLGDLSRYFVAAASLIADAVVGVDKLQAAQIPSADRQEVRKELEDISFAISMLTARQTPLLTDLSRYTRDVRTGMNVDVQTKTWKRILGDVKTISKTVSTTIETVEKSKWLTAAFNEENKLALRQVLLQRVGLLDRLSQLDAPSTPTELDQLDRMNEDYELLISNLDKLNVALTGTAERLK